MKLSLATKFNLVFIFIFTVGYLAIGMIADQLRKENARFWLESALLARGYTSSTPISPLLITQSFDISLNEVVGERDEIVGEQIISVPMKVLLKRPDTFFKTFMLSLLAVFVLVFVCLNAMVCFFVTRRICKLSRLADEVSMGKFDGDDFDVRGRDEVSGLAQSFSRMRTSLARALKMLEETT